MAMNRLSTILGYVKGSDPNLTNVKNLISKSTKLLSDSGLVRSKDGKMVLLPFLVRAKRKLENIICEEMEKMSAHEISLPILVRMSLLEATGRNTKEELFYVEDRAKNKYVLAATNEEAITHLMAESNIHEKFLPLRFYQISTKFRDELHTKHGLLRAKEFTMKDMYCFDNSPEARYRTYKEVQEGYHNFFKRLKVPFLCVRSQGNDMLSQESHEFHFLSDVGEDSLVVCRNCDYKTNKNLVQREEVCVKCSSSNIDYLKGIEVGHTFNIGTTFSEKLDARFKSTSGEKKFLEMSCYGIGVTRILGAGVEVLSSDSEIRWPSLLAPYMICIIPPKGGSKEEAKVKSMVVQLYTSLDSCFSGDVVIDDRYTLTIGKRVILDKGLGFPYIIVLGKTMLEEVPKIEVYDTRTAENYVVDSSNVVQFIKEKWKEIN